MRTIEKNDVDISALFKWSRAVEINDYIGNMTATIWVRLVGDADLNKARVYGYRKAAELRRKLKDEGSDENMAFMLELDSATEKESVIQAIVFLRVQDLYSKAIANTTYAEPKELSSDATQEEIENYQKLVDDYPEKFKKEVEKVFTKLQKDTEKSLRGKSEQEIFDLYRLEVINRLCSQELEKSHYEMCVYLGSYKDEKFKQKMFSSLDEFLNLHPSVKEKLIAEYKGLEIGMDFLKRLPEATQ